MKTFKDIPFELDNGCVKGQLIFDNNWGVSILMGPFTKGGLVGKYELTILQWIPEKNFSVASYNNPISNDTIGHLSQEEINALMKQIQEL
jgi:hypothetical protein